MNARDIKTKDTLRRDRVEELRASLTNQTPTDEQVVRIERIRKDAMHLGARIIFSTNPSRNVSLALTALEDCVMRAVKAIVLEGTDQ